MPKQTQNVQKSALENVAGNVIDIQNEFHDNRTRFGGFEEASNCLFGHFWGRQPFDPNIFNLPRSVQLP